MAPKISDEPRVVPAEERTTIHLMAATAVELTLPGADIGIAELVAEPAFPGPQPHIHHRHVERFYVAEGAFDFLVGDRTVRLGAGSFIEVPTGVVHDFRNAGDAPARLLGIVTPGDLVGYFEQVQELFVSGTFTPDALTELRRRFDTEEVPMDWTSDLGDNPPPLGHA